jgi:3,4-dihydroxy 2-butanone 4-phosphate synthase / GTP cyclohydrolase II
VNAGRAGLHVVVDDAGAGTGMLAVPAAGVTPEAVATMVRHSSGFLCVTLERGTLERLDLPAMRGARDDVSPVSYRVTVDAATGTTTGISATDRARTAALLADPTTVAADLRRPGHVVPVLARPDHAATAADRVHRLFGAAVVLADRPGGVAGTGVAGAGEASALAAALHLPVLHTREAWDEPDEFLAQLRDSLIVVR